MSRPSTPYIDGKKARPRLATRLATLALVMVVIIATIGGVVIYQRSTQWDPLGDYPIQTITLKYQLPAAQSLTGAHNSTATEPVLYLDQKATSTAQKCVKLGKGIVTVRGELSWVSDEPPGKIILISKGGGSRGPGCRSYTFQNSFPEAVRSYIDELTKQGVKQSRWHIFITETPIKPDGTTGVPRTAVSTTFLVVHTNTPADAVLSDGGS